MQQNKSECWQLILQGPRDPRLGSKIIKFQYLQLNFNSPILNLFSYLKLKSIKFVLLRIFQTVQNLLVQYILKWVINALECRTDLLISFSIPSRLCALA